MPYKNYTGPFSLEDDNNKKNNSQGRNNNGQGKNNGNQGKNNDDPGENNDNLEENNHESGEKGCKKNCFEIDAGHVCAIKVFELSVPVSIKPVVITHTPEVMCLGEPKVEPGIKTCRHACGEIDFTLSQRFSVATPVDFIVNECCGKLCVEECEDEDETGESEA